jgi:ASPIC and UnbV
LQKGHGVTFADIDNDGDQDVYTKIGGAFPGDAFGNALFENPGFGRHWLSLRLSGTRSNRFGLGAKIRAQIDDAGIKRSVYAWMDSGGSFGSNPYRVQLGFGQATMVELLEVYWPTTDTTQVFRNVPVDQILEITEGASSYRRLDLKQFSLAHDVRHSPSAIPIR